MGQAAVRNTSAEEVACLTDLVARQPAGKKTYVIARGAFTPVATLKRTLMRYIRHHDEPTKPVKWKSFDPSRMITSE